MKFMLQCFKYMQSQRENKKDQKKEMSYWEMMINGIVRPPRANYRETQLGGKMIQFKDRIYIKEDHSIKHEGKKIDLTIYVNIDNSPFLILYMHGNSSNRVEALNLIRYLPPKFSLVSFDFMGCGKNQEMDTISLGYRQALQTQTVVNYLKNNRFRVFLWGRSMGAATALLYGKAEFIVADSSFKTFRSLCKQVAKSNAPKIVPNCMITCFFPCVFSKLKKDVSKKADYDVDDLDIKEAVKKLNKKTVIVFLSGDSDKLIDARNSQKLFDECPCEEKYIRIFEGNHNTKRPDSIIIEVMDLMETYAKKNPYIDVSRLTEEQIVLNFQ